MEFGSPFVYVPSADSPNPVGVGNCLAVKFDFLEQKPSTVTGEPISCKKCRAIFNKFSVVQNKVWNCEFCEHQNQMDDNEEERQQFLDSSSRMDFFQGDAIKKDANSGMSPENYTIFCIDISGSMSITTPVKINKETVHKTRLQFVQQAVESQIKKLKAQNPKSKVGIITFSKDVQIIRDEGEKEDLDRNMLDSYEAIVEKASSFDFPKSVGETYDGLIKELQALEEGGSTSLGPALLIAVTMCSRAPGSKTIICTDGLANNGIGSLEKDMNDPFYDQVGQLAKRKGVNISVISIAGTNTRMEKLGTLADLTGGTVIMEEPTKMAANFEVAVNANILAINVQASVFVSHPGLSLFSEQEKVEMKFIPTASAGISVSNSTTTTTTTTVTTSPIHNSLTEDIGNATNETEICLEFLPNPTAPPKKMLYFQLQSTYDVIKTNQKFLTVITMARHVSSDLQAANANLNIPVLSSNVAQQCARLTQLGQYEMAREKAKQVKELLEPFIKTPEQAALFGCFMTAYNLSLIHI
eukprot:TRINITY_DN4248_c0_g1_i1.p1 TRINITY_DN4248_c0_g1~~TRINITY_DN4248_c0_g1_i1.p1  ORF type:complete len:526 (-),score=168.96 TRINITY_DN4248_c0_g1_i1:48-1625(-)